jgi:hypothetical protein
MGEYIGLDVSLKETALGVPYHLSDFLAFGPLDVIGGGEP